VAFRKLFIEPVVPANVAMWADRRRRPNRIAPWQDHAAILPDYAKQMRVDARAVDVGHDFLYRTHPGERVAGLAQVDYVGDWIAAEKAVTGVEVRDPTADLDVLEYCFGVPAEQYLVEGIDRSLIRRAMWGLLPESVLTNRLSGLQAADWYEKVSSQREQIAAEIAELSSSPLARRAVDLARLEKAIKTWPTGGWDSPKVVEEYHLALTRGVAGARFLRWVESANR
jgi:asparagine synthase (glutamine-hydrolysing)